LESSRQTFRGAPRTTRLTTLARSKSAASRDTRPARAPHTRTWRRTHPHRRLRCRRRGVWSFIGNLKQLGTAASNKRLRVVERRLAASSSRALTHTRLRRAYGRRTVLRGTPLRGPGGLRWGVGGASSSLTVWGL